MDQMTPHLTKLKNAVTLQSRFGPGWPLWFEWGETIGPYSFLALSFILYKGVWVHPLIVATVVHLFVDFFVQTDDTSQKKLSGDVSALAMHSILSGGYPALVLGFVKGDLWVVAASVLAHVGIDASRKFGLPNPYGPIIDQLAHILTLIIIWCFCPLRVW